MLPTILDEHLSTILGIGGIIATLIVGWVGYVLGLRHSWVRLTFTKENCIGLFESIVQNLRPELSILYQEKPVEENLVLLSGFIRNTSSKDITEQMVSTPLSINLPQGYRWIKGIIVAASHNVCVDIIVSEQQLTFNFKGIFCHNEYVKFQALAEVPYPQSSRDKDVGKSLERALRFEHRIADTNRIEEQEIPKEPQIKQDYRLLALFCIYFAAAIAFLAYPYIYDESIPKFGQSLILDNKRVDISVYPQANGTILLKSLDNEVIRNFNTISEFQEFYLTHDLELKLDYVSAFGTTYTKPIILLHSTLVIAILGAVVYYLRKVYKTRQLKKIFSE